MGNYSYDDHVELFGGPPEPGEGVDWRDYVDQERKARKEEPWPEPFPLAGDVPEEAFKTIGQHEREAREAARRPWWRWWRRGA